MNLIRTSIQSLLFISVPCIAFGRPPATEPGAPAVRAPDTVPCITRSGQNFRRVFTPNNNRYVNDHSLIYNPVDHKYHLIGITGVGRGDPQNEPSFIHASTSNIFGSWEEHADVLAARRERAEVNVWAPFTLLLANNFATIFYTGSHNAANNGLYTALSQDLFDFERLERGPLGTHSHIPGGRDPMIAIADTQEGIRFINYSVGVDAARSIGQIIVSTTSDTTHLNGWSTEDQVILEDPVPSYGWGNLESPYVIQKDGYIYLFLTRTGNAPEEAAPRLAMLRNLHAPGDYMRTLVFRSRYFGNQKPRLTDFYRFQWNPVAGFRAHASEVLEAGGRTFLTSAGWPSSLGEDRRGLSVVEIEFVERSVCATRR